MGKLLQTEPFDLSWKVGSEGGSAEEILKGPADRLLPVASQEPRCSSVAFSPPAGPGAWALDHPKPSARFGSKAMNEGRL